MGEGETIFILEWLRPSMTPCLEWGVIKWKHMKSIGKMRAPLSKLRNRYFRYRAILRFVILFVGVGIMIITSFSCDSDYERFTFDKEVYPRTPYDLGSKIPQFTLEYPRSFESVVIPPIYDQSSFYIYFPKRDLAGPGEFIYIDVQTPDFEGYYPFDFTLPEIKVPFDWSYGGSDAIFDYDVITEKIYTPSSWYSDARLLEDRKVKISGVSGIYTAYSYNLRPYGGKDFTVRYILRRVSFNHSGYVWVLSLESYPENDKEMEAYFNHLIKTFRVLD